jgi:lon-related putative ATP-dependent protease
MALTELLPDHLYRACNLEASGFNTTGDLEPLQQPLGQARALDALEFGVEIQRRGFNIFAFGPSGLGKHEVVREVLKKQGDNGCVRFDWCYVSNFSDLDKPRLLQLPSGVGSQLAEDMLQLVEDLLTSLPSTFESEDYRNRRQDIEAEMAERQEAAFSELGARAKERHVALVRTPAGYTLAPMVEDKVITPEKFSEFSEAEQEKIQEVIAELQSALKEVVSQLPMIKREASHRIKALNQEITQLTVEQFVAWLENKYLEYPKILDYVREVKNFAIENAEDFLPEDDGVEIEHVKQQAKSYSVYRVNVLVDNAEASGRPVVYEENPTYQNLIGRVEYVSQMGTLLTDFTLIKPGALHRANGGYLIIEARKLLGHLYAWEGLKQALRSGEIKISSLQEMLSLNSMMSLEPESAPLDVKVILLGEPFIYYMMNHYDPEFRQLFHVAADFSTDMLWDDDNQILFARMIATCQKNEQLQPVERTAVQLIIEQTARWAGDSEKLSLNQDSLGLLLHESDYWSRRNGRDTITREDVVNAIEKHQERRGRLRELVSEQVLRNFRLIDTSGSKTAQVNGLSVLLQGDYTIGSAARITATARLGSGKVVDIERESKLGGEVHSKGVLILSAYLADKYAGERPLSLAASLVFEQSYGGVDGDSASCAELCALLSAIAKIPLAQNLAVTGSMNQFGEVQAIGGVNEKIEGFFDICSARGLSGDQGVIIPASNQPHLMLKPEVLAAVKTGQFHIYTATHVEDVMERLSGLPAGQGRDSYEEGTFNRLVMDRIGELNDLQCSFAESHNGQGDNEQRG